MHVPYMGGWYTNEAVLHNMVVGLLQVVKSYQSGKKEGGDFVASWLSPRGAYLYCLGEDGNVFCFETIGKLESVLQVGYYTVCSAHERSDQVVQLDV